MRYGYLFQVKGIRPGAGWLDVQVLEHSDMRHIRKALKANGQEWMLDKREWRVVVKSVDRAATQERSE